MSKLMLHDFTKFQSHPTVYSDEYIILQNSSLTHFHFSKCMSPSGNKTLHRYFSIEARLFSSIEHCAPLEANANSCSLSYEFIIKESCAFIEILLKNIFTELDIPIERNTTIWELLQLDDFLLLSKRRVQISGLYDLWRPHIVEAPFSSLEQRKIGSNLLKSHLPTWWSAYNDLKHNPDSFSQQATQINAFASLSALFILIHRIYGPGLVSGILLDGDNTLHTRKESVFFSPVNFEYWSREIYFKHNWKEDPN